MVLLALVLSYANKLKSHLETLNLRLQYDKVFPRKVNHETDINFFYIMSSSDCIFRYYFLL